MNQWVPGKLEVVASRRVMQPDLLRHLVKEHGHRVCIIILFTENYGLGYSCINLPLQLECKSHAGKNPNHLMVLKMYLPSACKVPAVAMPWECPHDVSEGSEWLLAVVDALNGSWFIELMRRLTRRARMGHMTNILLP